MRKHLLIVSRRQAQLFGYLAETLGHDDSIQVLLDRRFADRRKRSDEHVPERRQGDGRKRDVDARLEGRGYVLVCLD